MYSIPIILLVILLATVAVYKTLSILISNYLWNKFSIVKDVHLLSKERPNDKKFSGTAVICGGSISGLMAARVCANHFKKVVIVEPEEWVAASEEGLEDHHRDPKSSKRSRVPQYTGYHHFHLIITLAMKEMFSTFEQAIRRAGGRLTTRSDILWVSGLPKLIPTNFPYYSGGIYPPVMSWTRPAFETTLRRLVLQTCEGVQYFHGTATGLLYDETLNRVLGVNVKLPNGETTELEGSLVIDATGSFMSAHRWLKAIPKFASSHSPSLDDIKISFEIKVSYSICEAALPPELEEKFRQYGFPTDDDVNSNFYASIPLNGVNDRGFMIEKREKNFLQIGCTGFDWHGKVRSLGDIEDFVKEMKLKQPLPEWVIDVLHTLQSEDVPASFSDTKYSHSIYIKYHEANYLPSNLVVVGDALTQTDPVFGQGCAKACATAIVLNSQLHRAVPDFVGFVPKTFAKQYFLDVKDRTEHIWTNMKNIDYNFPSTVPLPGEDIQTTARFIRKYGDLFLYLTTKDADISGAFYRQVSWLEPPTNILAPWIVRRILWAMIKQSLGYEIL